MGLVSGSSLANHCDSGSFLVACASLSQDGLQQGGFWEVGRTYGLASPLFFDLSGVLLTHGSLLVPCSLPGPPAVRQLMQVAALLPSQGGCFGQCFPQQLSAAIWPQTPRSSYSHCILAFQPSGCVSLCKLWTTEQSHYKALQGCSGFPHKLIS